MGVDYVHKKEVDMKEVTRFPYVVQCPDGNTRQIISWLWKNIGRSAAMEPKTGLWTFERQWRETSSVVSFKRQEDAVLFKMIWL